MSTPITENFSEKRKRGRPRSFTRLVSDDCQRAGLGVEGCYRTKMNHAYQSAFIGKLLDDEDTFTAIVGATRNELRNGTKRFPRGFKGAAEQIGRYLEATDDDFGKVLSIVADARRRGIGWSDIGRHFRQMRVTPRQGDPLSLMVCIEAALNRYAEVHPGWPIAETAAVLRDYAAALEDA